MAAPPAGGARAGGGHAVSLRVGIDVGGTFTKAVAVRAAPFALVAQAVVPTTHDAAGGVAEGVAAALRALAQRLGDAAEEIALVAFSTTQAMNALLEGDVVDVGVVGLGARPDLRAARRRTEVGDIPLAPGRRLHTVHGFLDATHGLDDRDVDAVLDALQARGARAIAVSGAFAVDAPAHEEQIAGRARQRGLPTCAGHELSGAYGLELRTVSAAINASILPLMERTAGVVERVLEEMGLRSPLLVLRGDGGAMSIGAFRAAPSLSIGAGPAAGVAAALHELTLGDGIVLECGGTSSNVSIVRGGRTVLRSLRVMGRPTALRAVDSWVVGAAGGSMGRLRRRGVAETGPRSAHVAGLPYACFAAPTELEGARLELVAPRAEDPSEYAAVRAPSGTLYALTATCAANALGLVGPDDPAAGSREAALAGFAALGARLRRTPEQAARALLDAAVEKIAAAVADAVRTHKLGPRVPVVALGGAGAALGGEVAARLGRPLVRPAHPEVLSSVGAALSLVRAEVARQGTGDVALQVAREAERACIEAGAAPDTVRVETSFEARGGTVRAVATGAVALEAGAASRSPVAPEKQLAAAAEALGVAAGTLQEVAATGYYRVFCENGSGPLAVVDEMGGVPLARRARRVLTGQGDGLLAPLQAAVAEATVQLGVAEVAPRVALVCGPRILDFSESRSAADVLRAAQRALGDHDGPAVAAVWQ